MTVHVTRGGGFAGAGDSLHASSQRQSRSMTGTRSVLTLVFVGLASLVRWTRERAPRAAARASHVVLTLVGLACGCAAAWIIALPLGLLAIMLACLILAELVKPR